MSLDQALITAFLGGDTASTAAGGTAAGRAPKPSVPTSGVPQSTGALKFEADPNKRAVGQVYDLPNGRQALWTKDPKTGQVGWELLN